MSRLLHFPSHSNDRNGNVTIFTAPNVDNVHHYKLIRLARIRIAYLDPSLHLVSTLHSLGLFPRPDSSVRLCSPALHLAHSDCVLTRSSVCLGSKWASATTHILLHNEPNKSISSQQ